MLNYISILDAGFSLPMYLIRVLEILMLNYSGLRCCNWE